MEYINGIYSQYEFFKNTKEASINSPKLTVFFS